MQVISHCIFNQGMADTKQLNILLLRQVWYHRSRLLHEADLGTHQIQMPDNPSIVGNFSRMRPYHIRHCLQNLLNFIALVCPTAGNLFIEINHRPRLNVNRTTAGRNIVNDACNTVTVGIFYRQYIATIPTGHHLVCQHISFGFENLLQDISNLNFIFLNFSANTTQLFTSKTFEKAPIIDSLQASLNTRKLY